MNFRANETAQKLRGGYYTDLQIASYLAHWVLERNPSSLLEPSCGGGSFFAALAQNDFSSLEDVTGCEIDPAEAAVANRCASERLPGVRSRIIVGDFLSFVLRHLNSPPAYDAVLGNPPFIRYQYLTPELQSCAEKLITTLGLPFTKHTNAWVPFVIGSIARLRPAGRIAMVVPAEILHVLHAQSVRQFLLDRCSSVLIVDPVEIWFGETLQGVVLLLAEARTVAQGSSKARVAIERIRGTDFLSRPAEEHFASASYVAGETLPAKWTFALLSKSEQDLITELRQRPGIVQFDSVGSASVGIVTGANKFFLVPDAVVAAYELEAFAHPMFGRSEHVPGVIYSADVHRQNRKAGLPANFIWFDGVPRNRLPTGALRYIAAGESQGLHTRFKCRVREPWYSVPSVFTAPVGMLKRSHDFPRLILNTLGAYSTDTAYRVFPRNVAARDLVFGFVNSLTALCCELEGRYYGGGVLELVPSEINRLLIPKPLHTNGRLGMLNEVVRSLAPPETVLATQDRAVLEPRGIQPAECEALRNAWWKLRNRRHRSGVGLEAPESDS